MNLTREDVLRELELLPVWKLKVSPQPTIIKDEVANIEPIAKAEIEHLQPKEIAIAKEKTYEKTYKAWLFFYAANHQTQNSKELIHNIVKAMQILQTDYVLIDDAQLLNNYQAKNTLIFGLESANACLTLHEADLEVLRGKPHAKETNLYWVTYDPIQMLENPLLKLHAWQDIAMALQS